MILPILLYGSEVWGIYNFKEIDALHFKFLKIILGVKQSTSNMAVLGETGRYPLAVLCKERALKFYIKIMNKTDSIMYRVFTNQRNINTFCWFKACKSYFDYLGNGDLFENSNISINFASVRQRIRDQFQQTWLESISNMPKLSYYCKFKSTFEYEDYLDYVSQEKSRITLTRLRLSSHNLEIETGRYRNVDRNNRVCRLCSLNTIESEYHFLLCCTTFTNIRKKYLVNTSWPSMNMFINFMSSRSKRKIRSVAKYCYNASILRDALLAV